MKMTGSQDLTTYVICGKCCGLVSAHNESTVTDHLASCTGDVTTSPCEQFAVEKCVVLELLPATETTELSQTPTQTKKKAKRKRKVTEEYIPVVVKQEKVDAEPVTDVSNIRRSKRTPKPKYKHDMVENTETSREGIASESTVDENSQQAKSIGKENQVVNKSDSPVENIHVMNEVNTAVAMVTENAAANVEDIITIVQDIGRINHSTEDVLECEAVEDDTRATLEAIIEAKTEPCFPKLEPEEEKAGKTNYAEKKQQLLQEFTQYKEEVTEKGNTEDVYRCPKCKTRTFRANFIGMFARHVRTCKPSGSDELKCPEPDCTFVAKDAKRFSEHKRYHLQPYMCEFCPQRFADKRNMIEHRMMHTDERPYACDMCDYRTRNKRLLKEHRRKHTGEFLHCPESGCGFFTAYQGSLTSHIELRHRERTKYECAHCSSYVTNSRANLKRHLATAHAGDEGVAAADTKLFQCSLCSYMAATKFAVISHLRSHTKEKIYFCNKCDYAASYASAFRQHMMTHLGLKTWQCGPCGYNSNTRAKVHRHLHTKHPDVDSSKAVVNLGLSLKLDLSTFRRAGERKYELEEVTMEAAEVEQAVEQAAQVVGGEEIVVSDDVIGDATHELIVMTENGQIVIPQKTTIDGTEIPVHEFHIESEEVPQSDIIQVIPGIQ